MKTRRIYASIAGLLQVNLTQLALKIAARDGFIIQSSGYLTLIQKDQYTLTIELLCLINYFAGNEAGKKQATTKCCYVVLCGL